MVAFIIGIDRIIFSIINEIVNKVNLVPKYCNLYVNQNIIWKSTLIVYEIINITKQKTLKKN